MTTTRKPKLQNCPCCGSEPTFLSSRGITSIVCPKNCILVQGKGIAAMCEQWNERRFNQRKP
jgi:hypothetical protein